jgi:hypothetical protein
MLEDNYQKYLDQKFKSLDDKLDNHQQYTRLELKQIKENTERINGKVADQEARLRIVEKKQQSCPISNLIEDQEQMKKETRQIRAWAIVMKPAIVLVIVTMIGLILQIVGVV